MFATLLLLFVMQSPTVLQSQANGFPVLGKLQPATSMGDFQMALIEVLLENEEGRIVDRTTASPNGEFRFNRVMVGRYHIVLEGEKFMPVRHRLEIDVRTFGVVNVAIPLRPLSVTNRAPEEETISVDSLQRKIPRDAVNAYNKALEEQRKGKTKEAVSNFQKSLRIAPDFFEPRLHLGLHYYRAGNNVEAIKELEKAVELNPSTASGAATLGRLYYESEQYQKAVDLLIRIAKLPAATADMHFYLGSAYYKLGTFDLAEENLLRVLTLAPTYSGAHLQLCNVYMRTRRPVKALEQLDLYLERFPNASDHASIQEQAEKIRQIVKR